MQDLLAILKVEHPDDRLYCLQTRDAKNAWRDFRAEIPCFRILDGCRSQQHQSADTLTDQEYVPGPLAWYVIHVSVDPEIHILFCPAIQEEDVYGSMGEIVEILKSVGAGIPVEVVPAVV